MATTTLHPKLKELKAKAAPINYRGLSVNDFGTLIEDYQKNLQLGIIEGYGLRFGVKNMYKERVEKGACVKSLNERGPGKNSMYEIKLLIQHDQGEPMANFEYVVEDTYGLKFKSKPVDDVPTVQRRLKQIISGTVNNYSVGFLYVWDKMEYDDATDTIVHNEINLVEISSVTIPVDMGTYTKRSLEDMEDLYDEVEEFIDSLPRKLRLEARQLFARHKSLINLEPLDVQRRALDEEGKPTREQSAGAARKINFDYLIQNL